MNFLMTVQVKSVLCEYKSKSKKSLLSSLASRSHLFPALIEKLPILRTKDFQFQVFFRKLGRY